MISYFRPESRDDLTWSVLFFLVTLSDCQVPLGGRLHLVLTTTRCDEMGQFSICFLVYYPCFNTSYAILFDFLRSCLVISIEKETWLFLVPDIPSLDFRHIKKKKKKMEQKTLLEYQLTVACSKETFTVGIFLFSGLFEGSLLAQCGATEPLLQDHLFQHLPASWSAFLSSLRHSWEILFHNLDYSCFLPKEHSFADQSSVKDQQYQPKFFSL